MRVSGRNTVDWVQVVVVGAGPAGLAASSRLARAGCHHVVLERGRIGSTWRAQRWDSFRLNTPQWLNLVPGEFLDGAPDSFSTAGSLVAALERFAHGLPVFEGVEVFRASGSSTRRSARAQSLLFQNVPHAPAARGRSISYQGLASRGATLLGRSLGWSGRRLELAPDLGANVEFADGVSQSFRAAWDAHAVARAHGQLDGHRDPADEPAEDLHRLSGPDSLDLAAAGISSVIWATGFDPSTKWLPKGALDTAGHPRLPALHVIGAPWLTHRSSANLYGMAADAELLASMYSGAALAA